jgi:ribosome modulation factor
MHFKPKKEKDKISSRCRDEGYEARLAGKRKEDNPYPNGSWSWTNWMNGWRAADEHASET